MKFQKPHLYSLQEKAKVKGFAQSRNTLSISLKNQSYKEHLVHDLVHAYNKYIKFELDQIQICHKNYNYTTQSFSFPIPTRP